MSEIDESRDNPVNRWWLAAAAFMVVVAATFGFVLFGPGQSPSEPPSTSTPSTSGPATAAGPTPPSTSSASSCPQGAATDKIPSSAPAGVKWALEQGVALPESSAGPHARTGDVRQCFEHSPTGALLAAATYAASTQLPSREQLVALRVSPGPEKDAALRAVKSMGTVAAESNGQIAAFRILSYSQSQAVVSVVLKKDAGRFAVVTYPMLWTAGDWLINGAPEGGMPPAQPATDISGYIAWAGV